MTEREEVLAERVAVALESIAASLELLSHPLRSVPGEPLTNHVQCPVCGIWGGSHKVGCRMAGTAP